MKENSKLLDPLLDLDASEVEYVVYGRRWYICAVFSISAFVMGMSWNIYSPISEGMHAIYHWDIGYIGFLTNLSGLCMLGTILPAGALLSATSMRFMAVLSAGFCALSCGLRCVPVGPDTHRGFAAAAMVFNGLAASSSQLLAPAISSIWFKAEERTIATSMMLLWTAGGAAVGHVIGPLLVPPDGTLLDLRRLYWVEFCGAAAVFLCILVYFPSKPPTPNSKSSDVKGKRGDRPRVFAGMLKLVRERRAYWRFWLLALGFGIPSGMHSGWSLMLTPNLLQHGFDEIEAGWLGFVSVMGGCVAGIISGVFLDTKCLARRKKGYLVGLYFIATAASAYFTLASFGFADAAKPLLYASAVVTSTALKATFAIFFEISIEETFPVPEAASSMILLLLVTTFQSVFLFLPIEKWGTDWMNPVMAATIPVFALLMLPLEITYRRMDLDGDVDAMTMTKREISRVN